MISRQLDAAVTERLKQERRKARQTAQGNEPRFDLDVEYGRQGELQFAELLEWIANGDGRVEVKRKRECLDHRFYVETEHDPGATGHYVPSGISVTTAVLWAFVIGDTGIHVAIPTELIRAALEDPSSHPVTQPRGSCPSRGKLIDLCVLLFRLDQQQKRARAAGK